MDILVEKWECRFQNEKRRLGLKFDRDLSLRLPLNPRDAYYGGRTNATKLYKNCTGVEQVKYKDFTSMYPWAMQAFRYPIREFQIRRFDDPGFPLVPLSDLFGLQKCDVTPPNTLSFQSDTKPQVNRVGKILYKKILRIF